MHQLILYIKSYRPDFKQVMNLLKSINTYNIDKIPVYISVNDEDFLFFKDKIPSHISLLKDSEIAITNVTDGWRYQQIIKSQVHKLGICKNYLCLDSDSEFIRDFSISDFMYDENTPYTIMHESKPFLEMLEIIGFDSHNVFTINASKAIKEIFQTNGKNWDYGPSPYLWSTKVWKHFHEEYLTKHGYTLESFFDKIEETALPSEMMIYGEYLCKTRLIDIMPVEGFFKVYHYEKQYKLEKKHYDIKKLSKNYMGIIMQSNWYGKKKRRFFNR